PDVAGRSPGVSRRCFKNCRGVAVSIIHEVSLSSASLLEFADDVKNQFNGHLAFMVAEDTRQRSGGFTIRYIFEILDGDTFIVASMALEAGQECFPSLASYWYRASLFEREIHDLFGIRPQDHPDLRRLTLHQFWPDHYYPLRKDSEPPPSFEDDGKAFPFQQVHGEGIYQIAVGPVHAGIIEPGHFRFSVDGETVVNL